MKPITPAEREYLDTLPARARRKRAKPKPGRPEDPHREKCVCFLSTCVTETEMDAFEQLRLREAFPPSRSTFNPFLIKAAYSASTTDSRTPSSWRGRRLASRSGGDRRRRQTPLRFPPKGDRRRPRRARSARRSVRSTERRFSCLCTKQLRKPVRKHLFPLQKAKLRPPPNTPRNPPGLPGGSGFYPVPLPPFRISKARKPLPRMVAWPRVLGAQPLTRGRVGKARRRARPTPRFTLPPRSLGAGRPCRRGDLTAGRNRRSLTDCPVRLRPRNHSPPVSRPSAACWYGVPDLGYES